MKQHVWLFLGGAMFVFVGVMYLLAGAGVEALENLKGSAGGTTFQGLGAIAIGLVFFGVGEKKRREG